MFRGRRLAVAALFCGASVFSTGGVVTSTGAELAMAPDEAVAEVTVPVTEPSTTTTSTTTPPAPTTTVFVRPDRPEQWFAPSGRNEGTEGLAMYLAQLAIRDNAPLYLSEGWGRTTGAPTSDHHVSRTDSWAVDVAVRGIQQPTPATHEAARRIAAALGQPNWTGGDLTKTVNGYRFQVLWLVEGHYNHVHVGVRKM